MFGIGSTELVLLMFFCIPLYLIPGCIARKRRHKNTAPIFAVNILLGWTFLGWVIALVWALTAQEEKIVEM